MATIKLPSIGLSITSDAKPVDKVQALLDSFKKAIPSMMKHLGQTAKTVAKEIAPVQPDTILNNKGQPKAIRQDEKRLKSSIRLSLSEDGSFSLTAGGGGRLGTKAYMQEYGYPYQTRFGPYKPNPKNNPSYNGTPAAAIRKVGYLRVGLIKASESLISGKVNYYKKPSNDQVRNYDSIVKNNISKALKKLLFDFARGKENLPNYITSVVSVPSSEGTISKFAAKFGTVGGLGMQIPLSVQVDPAVFSERGIVPGFNFLK
jgi:hypothetical protein